MVPSSGSTTQVRPWASARRGAGASRGSRRPRPSPSCVPCPAGPVMRARLLGQDPVARDGAPDRLQDQRLGEVVHLRDDVPCGLVVDDLDPLVALEEDPPGRLRELARELGVGAVTPRSPRSAARGESPNVPTTTSNVTDPPPGTCGALDVHASGPMPPSAGSSIRHVAVARGARALVVDGDRDLQRRPDPGCDAGDRARERPDVRDREPRDEGHATTATPMPTIAIPCACDAAGDFSPSGLHRSHIDSEIGTGAPHRTQPWVGSWRGWRRARTGGSSVRRW